MNLKYNEFTRLVRDDEFIVTLDKVLAIKGEPTMMGVGERADRREFIALKIAESHEHALKELHELCKEVFEIPAK